MARLFLAFLLCIFSQQLIAWEDHAMLTRTVLSDWSDSDKSMALYLNQQIKPESLKSFLEATRSTLPVKLHQIELWLNQNEPGYKSLPETLMYQPQQSSCTADIEVCFKKALRVNLDVPLPLVIYDPLHEYLHQQGFVSVTNARQILPAYIPPTFNYQDFTIVPASGQIKMADIISTASMQPDFGLDTFLYEDSQTAFGKIYGFGTQPMGNPAYPFHSQMLFHMSAYHEDGRILAMLPRLAENYPEYRAYMYLQLSRFAAETKHPYWAGVFLGWGLHYIQDLTQPYHSRISYGLDVNDVLQAFQETAKKNYSPYIELETIQANRHVIFENLTEYIGNSSDVYKKTLFSRINNRHADTSLPVCDISSQYLRHQVNNSNPADFQSIFQLTIPNYYFSSPQFHADDLKNYEGLFTQEMSRSQRQRFTEATAQLLEAYGAYTRVCVSYYAKA